MQMHQHSNYQRLVAKAQQSHQQNRSTAAIDRQDVVLARLYSYAFRGHVIGAFHATRVALDDCPAAGGTGQLLRQRTVETLEDLASQSVENVPVDFNALISSFHRYHRGIERVLDSLSQELAESADSRLGQIADRFRLTMESITSECGIHLTTDTEAPEQASFVVPGLGIIIVPLVYGDHHSWNLAWLAGEHRDVPTHRHHHGVEIHLGYDPTHGQTILGDCRASVDEGYAMPIPPKTDHGWVNTSSETHHVPFIFGSLQHAGWGVYLDVEPRIRPLEELKLVDRDSPMFGQMVYLEREIEAAAKMFSTRRKTLIPFSVTRRGSSGGLELSLTRINKSGFSLPLEGYRTVAVVRGRGIVEIEGVSREIGEHDHFGVPSQLSAQVRQIGDSPLVLLDATIKGY